MDNNKKWYQCCLEFSLRHPFITWFLLDAAIHAPANIIKACKWDGHYPETIYGISTGSSKEDNEENLPQA